MRVALAVWRMRIALPLVIPLAGVVKVQLTLVQILVLTAEVAPQAVRRVVLPSAEYCTLRSVNVLEPLVRRVVKLTL